MKYADMDQNLQELCNWVDSHFLKRRKKNLNRDFSDAVHLAEILKQHYPKLVDLHNYGRKNAILKKLENWNILNRKVLCKLGLQLSQKELENIAKCVPGSIEKLLLKVKAKIDAENKEGELMKVEENRVDHNNISKIELEQVSVQEIQGVDTKTEAVEDLRQKISNMQQLLHLKDQRITELQHELDKYMSREKTRSGFFEIFTR